VIEIEGGSVRVYPGNYEDYLWRKQGGLEALAPADATPAAPAHPSERSETAKRVNPMKLKKLQNQVKEVEQEVQALESEIAQHEAALADFKSVEETLRLTALVDENRKRLNARVAQWERLSAELEATV
jgi:ATP-binding cassette, subfamily F, member 3